MEISELKNVIETVREHAKNATGKGVRWSETGPVGFKVIDALVAAVEAIEKRVAALEAK